MVLPSQFHISATARPRREKAASLGTGGPGTKSSGNTTGSSLKVAPPERVVASAQGEERRGSYPFSAATNVVSSPSARRAASSKVVSRRPERLSSASTEVQAGTVLVAVRDVAIRNGHESVLGRAGVGGAGPLPFAAPTPRPDLPWHPHRGRSPDHSPSMTYRTTLSDMSPRPPPRMSRNSCGGLRAPTPTPRHSSPFRSPSQRNFGEIYAQDTQLITVATTSSNAGSSVSQHAWRSPSPPRLQQPQPQYYNIAVRPPRTNILGIGPAQPPGALQRGCVQVFVGGHGEAGGTQPAAPFASSPNAPPQQLIISASGAVPASTARVPWRTVAVSPPALLRGGAAASQQAGCLDASAPRFATSTVAPARRGTSSPDPFRATVRTMSPHTTPQSVQRFITGSIPAGTTGVAQPSAVGGAPVGAERGWASPMPFLAPPRVQVAPIRMTSFAVPVERSDDKLLMAPHRQVAVEEKLRQWLSTIQTSEPYREWDDAQILKIVLFAKDSEIEHLPAEDIYRLYVVHQVEMAEEENM